MLSARTVAIDGVMKAWNENAGCFPESGDVKPVQSERREQERIDGELVRQGIVAAERKALKKWLAELPGPWYEAMEATIFTGWGYDFLKPQALELKVSPELQVGVEKGGYGVAPIQARRSLLKVAVQVLSVLMVTRQAMFFEEAATSRYATEKNKNHPFLESDG